MSEIPPTWQEHAKSQSEGAIVALLYRAPLRFKEFKYALERSNVKLSKPVLVQRLRSLEKQGIVEREFDKERRAVVYRLVDAGRYAPEIAAQLIDFQLFWRGLAGALPMIVEEAEKGRDHPLYWLEMGMYLGETYSYIAARYLEGEEHLGSVLRRTATLENLALTLLKLRVLYRGGYRNKSLEKMACAKTDNEYVEAFSEFLFETYPDLEKERVGSLQEAMIILSGRFKDFWQTLPALSKKQLQTVKHDLEKEPHVAWIKKSLDNARNICAERTERPR